MNNKTKITIFSIIVFICLLCGIYIIANLINTNKYKEMKETHNTDFVTIKVNGLDMLLNLGNEKLVDYNAPQLTTEFENTFRMDDLLYYDIKIDNKKLKEGKDLKVKIDEISKEKTIPLEIKDKVSNKVYKLNIRTFNNKINVETTGEGYEDGYYYFISEGTAIKMDNKGNVVFYSSNDYRNSFRPYLINDKVYYSMQKSVGDDSIINTKAYRRSKNLVFNDKYEVIDEVSTLIDGDLPKNYYLDGHDFTVIDKGHYLISGYVEKAVNNIPFLKGDVDVVVSVIQEIKDGKLVQEWRSSDYPELYALSKIKDNFKVNSKEEKENKPNNDIFEKKQETNRYVDYAHFNSMFIDPNDNNLVVSYRNICSVIKFDRKTGKIIWILGGDADQFNLTDKQKFYYQHHATISNDNTLTIFDNGVANEQTRALEFKLDEKNKKVIEFNEYKIDGYFSGVQGSTAKINDDIFLSGWGGNKSHDIMFSEVDYKTNKVLFEAKNKKNSTTYRVYKFNK